MKESGSLSRKIDSAQVTPLYHQVRLVLQESIANGVYRAGDLLPTEDELCRQFDVSKTTVKSALKKLAEEGLVSRQQGRGTFVARRLPRSEQQSDVATLIEGVAAIGEATEIGNRESSYVEPDDILREIFGLGPEDQLWRDQHLRLLNGIPLGQITAYVPLDIAEGFAGQGRNNLPVLLNIEKSGVHVAKADQSVGATIADPVLANKLEIPPGAALVRLHRRVMDASGRVVEDLSALYRADRYEYRTVLLRHSKNEDAALWLI